MEKKKTVKTPRQKKIKVDLASLQDAIVDGKLTLQKNAAVLFERRISGETRIHRGTIFNFDDRSVSIWDETIEQFYYVDINDKSVIKSFVQQTK